jgi:hypothetical protein
VIGLEMYLGSGFVPILSKLTAPWQGETVATTISLFAIEG